MKTTLNLNDRLLRSAKKAAAERGVTLTSVVEDALRTSFAKPAKSSGYVFRWKTHKGTMAPGVDINSREKLYDFMDGIA